MCEASHIESKIMKDNEKLYKVYHRNYKTIAELYDDLSDVVLNIDLDNDKITIRYNADILEIEPCHLGYRTYLNGKSEAGVWEDQDIYFYALGFVHEQQKNLTELEIHDTSIIDVASEGITYVDEFDRKHFVSYGACVAKNPNTSCVAERDVTKRYFKFYGTVSIRVVFRTLFVSQKRNSFLVGGRTKRFRTLQKAILDSGYTTYDLS